MREPCQNSALCSNGFGLVVWYNLFHLMTDSIEARAKQIKALESSVIFTEHYSWFDWIMDVLCRKHCIYFWRLTKQMHNIVNYFLFFSFPNGGFKHRVTKQYIHNCCPGWAQVSKSSHGCTKRNLSRCLHRKRFF